MKVILQKKSQPPQNRNKVWVKSTSSTVEHENTISSRKQQLSRKPIPKVNNRDYADVSILIVFKSDNEIVIAEIEVLFEDVLNQRFSTCDKLTPGGT
ncbi:hypothetical protein AVEN_209882-1 [Araneus ventricosus]|uniref:Uncharacterized protein n=1 Tax=Araneus ventricosus TaxID=182803 RepID=A0A4Y2MC32_ARAVE|nr:hypothetical protein AVEN_209882-1 [Araneus ventricosus]